MENWLARARKRAGLSEEDAARVLRMSGTGYAHAERRPGTLTIDEIGALCRAMGEADARAMLEDLFETLA